MAPAADRPGYWGTPTSTLDWCEENYAVSSYVAEFWNTLSNLIMILPPIYGAIQTVQDRLEKRYLAAYLGLTAVGLGSWCFHMTLQYEMQLLDELPMIYSCCIFVYCLVSVLRLATGWQSFNIMNGREHGVRTAVTMKGRITKLCKSTTPHNEEPVLLCYKIMQVEEEFDLNEVTFKYLEQKENWVEWISNGSNNCMRFECFKYRKSYNYVLMIMLILFSLIVTTLYLKWKEPVFHQVMYGLLVSCLVLRSVYIVTWVYPWLRGLAYTSLGVFLLGFILWNVDNVFCDTWRGLRQKMPPVLGAVTQFHAWWHILTGLGSYLHILFSLYTRTLYLKYRPKVKFIFGMWPVILVEQPKKK